MLELKLLGRYWPRSAPLSSTIMMCLSATYLPRRLLFLAGNSHNVTPVFATRCPLFNPSSHDISHSRSATFEEEYEDKMHRVKKMLVRLRAENLEPDDYDMGLIQAYIDNKITLKDLLNHARRFATEAHYRNWIRDVSRIGGNGEATAQPVDQFLLELEALMRRKSAGRRT